jgi:NADPH-dependent FMN reductase
LAFGFWLLVIGIFRPAIFLVAFCLRKSRNDGTCPGEISKTFRLLELAREVLKQAEIQADVLDLSLLTSEYDLNIHPCKGCASTAMPLCHWPCSCYPNHALRQTNGWMAEIYERWTAAVAELRSGRLQASQPALSRPRPK